MSSSSSGRKPCNYVHEISPLANAVGQVRWGDNGASGTDPEYCVGKTTWNGPTTEASSGTLTWGSPTPSGTDSGWVSISLVSSGGSTSLNVGGASASYGAGPSNITGAQFSASAAKAGCKISFRGMVVKYYRQTVKVDTEVIDPDCNPVVNGPGGLILNSSTTQTIIDRVEVTGEVRLQLAPGVTASGDDLSGAIYVVGNQ